MSESRDPSEDDLQTDEEKLAFLSQLQDAIHIGVAVTDKKGRLLHVNRGLCEMLERRAEDIHGKLLADLVEPKDTKKQALAKAKDCLEGESELPIEEWLITQKDDGPRWLEISNSLLELTTGTRYCVLTVIDITRRKQLEEERYRLQNRAGKHERIESLGILASGIAHRFNNLLTSILGYTDLARSLLPPHSRIDSMLSEVSSAAKSAADLTKQMLAFTGKGRFIIRPLLLSRLVQEMLPELKTILPPGAVLATEVAAGLPMMEGDADQLRQLVTNLVTNAGDALGQDEGIITLQVGMRHVEAPTDYATHASNDLTGGDYVVLSVTDTGCGIPAVIQDHIFDPFYSTKFQGRGMGLAAVLGITEGHNGFLHVQSEVGAGSTFEVFFPPLPTAATGQKTTSQEKSASDRPMVLLIEDEESLALLIKKILEPEDIAVVHARHEEEGVALLQQYHYAVRLILVSFALPRRNGTHVIGKLMKLAPDIPIVLMTGYRLPEIREQFPMLPPDLETLQKPFTPAALLAVVKRLLNDEGVTKSE